MTALPSDGSTSVHFGEIKHGQLDTATRGFADLNGGLQVYLADEEHSKSPRTTPVWQAERNITYTWLLRSRFSMSSMLAKSALTAPSSKARRF